VTDDGLSTQAAVYDGSRGSKAMHLHPVEVKFKGQGHRSKFTITKCNNANS